MKKLCSDQFYTLVTGATGGIGKSFCKQLAIRGRNLYLTGRDIKKLEKLKEEIQKDYPNLSILTCACDLTSQKSRENLFSTIITDGVLFDGLCNVAGVDIQKAFENYTQEKIIFQCRVNLEATLCITKFILERKAPTLEIITISSMSGVYPMPYFAIYSATKSALLSFFSSLRIEQKKNGVKVTTVMPGGVYTRPDIIKDIKGQGLWGKLSAKSPDFIAKKSLKAVKKNKRKIIPGFWNKVLATVPKIIPLSWRMHFIANRWKKLEKDAF